MPKSTKMIWMMALALWLAVATCNFPMEVSQPAPLSNEARTATVETMTLTEPASATLSYATQPPPTVALPTETQPPPTAVPPTATPAPPTRIWPTLAPPIQPPPTNTPTRIVPTPVPPFHPPIPGDIILQDIFLWPEDAQILVRVAVNPPGSLSGPLTYALFIDDILKKYLQ